MGYQGQDYRRVQSAVSVLRPVRDQDHYCPFAMTVSDIAMVMASLEAAPLGSAQRCLALPPSKGEERKTIQLINSLVPSNYAGQD